MRRSRLAAFAFVTAAFAADVPAQQQQQIDNVAAFARLYGVARWFYPSDAAAALDWNRFAAEGARRVRNANTPAELEQALEELFTPLGPGIEIGTSLSARKPTGGRDASLVAWHYRGPGITEGIAGPYSAKRMNRTAPVRPRALAMTATMMQSVVADTLRGKMIRMRGHVRIADTAAPGWTGMWLRVDRGKGVAFMDNMENRPVRDTAWREYVIEAPIAPDATGIVFGVLVVGSVSVDVDAIELAVRDSGGTWKPLAINDASFEMLPGSGGRSWGQNGTASYTRRESGAAHGSRFVRIAPPAVVPAPPAPPVAPVDSFETPVAGATVDIELARGVKARVPLSLTDAEARTESPALAGLRAALAATSTPFARDDTDVRLADVVVAWNVFRHFYPYWGDIAVNWDERLRPQLETALSAATARDAHLDAVRMVVADLRDGHGSVYDVATRVARAMLPLQFRILNEQLVVTASTDATVPVGSIVKAIDGTPAPARVATEMRLASGTTQWQRTRAEGALAVCRVDATVTLTIEAPNAETRDARLPCVRALTRTNEARPDSITELRPGIWYVDLTRIRSAQLRPMLDTLAKARGVIFDMRGYPTDAGAAVLPHLMNTAENANDRWMHIPRFARPFGEVATWEDNTWHLQPLLPHIGGSRVFMTDGRAISYAESVMGYVRDYKLGTIIGGTTAGANGNVASFSVPGGFSIGFTGMRVTRHDGRSVFHTDGVSADIPIVPTLAGIRAGRDEVLERALLVFRITP